MRHISNSDSRTGLLGTPCEEHLSFKCTWLQVERTSLRMHWQGHGTFPQQHPHPY